MKQFEVVGPQIAGFVNDPEQKLKRLIVPWKGTRFVVCGTSGSGITRSIDLANSLLPVSEQVAESREIVLEKDLLKAVEALENAELEYESSLHIAFTVYNSHLAKVLELKGFKVFWLDGGSTGKHWQA